MHLEVEKEFIDEINNNSFLLKKAKEFMSLKKEAIGKFLDENPDFVQMMMHKASSDKIKVIYD